MLIKKPSDINPSEITSESVYRNRRRFIRDSGTLALGMAVGAGSSSTVSAQDGDSLKARAPVTMQRTPPASWWEDKFTSIKPAPDSEPFFTGETYHIVSATIGKILKILPQPGRLDGIIGESRSTSAWRLHEQRRSRAGF